MKKKSIILAIAVISVFIFNVDLFSQDKNYFASLIGGISFPVGDFSFGYKPGFNIEGRVGVKTSGLLGIGIDVSYNKFSLRQTNWIASGGENMVLSLKGLMLFKNFISVSKVVPYATIAAGVKMSKSLTMKTIWGSSYTSEFYNTFAVDLGGGVSFKTSKDLEIDLETKLNSSFDNPVRIFSVNFKAGMNYNF